MLSGVIENDEDVDDRFRGETGHCGAANVMHVERYLRKIRTSLRKIRAS